MGGTVVWLGTDGTAIGQRCLANITLLLFPLSLPGAGVGDLISQWPRTAVQKPGEAVTMNCYQNDTVRTYMLWYQQPQGEGLKLIATAFTKSQEPFKTRYSMSRPEIKKTTLTISAVKVEDTAVYFCALCKKPPMLLSPSPLQHSPRAQPHRDMV
uniref:Ig-like domain-containing protein n=1 Tax=Pelusios castaneus TaxID=367368 RepID=A0A8C8S0K1_9SAUR